MIVFIVERPFWYKSSTYSETCLHIYLNNTDTDPVRVRIIKVWLDTAKSLFGLLVKRIGSKKCFSSSIF